MDDLISRQAVKEWLEMWEGYLDKDMIARMQLKVDDIPTHETPSNTLDISVCVDKQAVIDQINRLINDKHHIKIGTSTFRDGVIDGYSRVLSMVNRLPSVQPREGKWTYRDGKPATIGKSYSVFCSECKEWQEYCTNFCPNCGADMRGDQE
ncbi:MAG: hypothetical protein IIY21_17130 [Clostridiales bacterium]|nr:hypothetical protein [Clostridiales bacterium]